MRTSIEYTGILYSLMQGGGGSKIIGIAEAAMDLKLPVPICDLPLAELHQPIMLGF